MDQKIFLFTATAVLLLSIDADAISEEGREKLKSATTACQGRYPVPAEQLKEFADKGILKDENNEAGYCFVQCIMEEFGAVKNGVFMTEEKKKLVEKYFGNQKKADGTAVDVAKLKKNVDDCAMGATGDMPCQKNYRIWTCIQQRGVSEM